MHSPTPPWRMPGGVFSLSEPATKNHANRSAMRAMK
jgi:hypothetical protein